MKSIECNPSLSPACMIPCELGATDVSTSCRFHNFACFPLVSANDSTGVCDCSRDYGCRGENCDDLSVSSVVWTIIGLITVAIWLFTLLSSLSLLRKLLELRALWWNFTCITFLTNTAAAVFGVCYILETYVRRALQCNSETSPSNVMAFMLCLSLYGGFSMVAQLNVAIIWSVPSSKEQQRASFRMLRHAAPLLCLSASLDTVLSRCVFSARIGLRLRKHLDRSGQW